VNEVEGVYEKYAEHYCIRLLAGNKLFRDFHDNHYGENFAYGDFAPIFKAEYFNPAGWAELFKESGTTYVVLTSKHHDGFCLWPSTWWSMTDGIKKHGASTGTTTLPNTIWYTTRWVPGITPTIHGRRAEGSAHPTAITGLKKSGITSPPNSSYTR
jgi:hypothetical protein